MIVVQNGIHNIVVSLFLYNYILYYLCCVCCVYVLCVLCVLCVCVVCVVCMCYVCVLCVCVLCVFCVVCMCCMCVLYVCVVCVKTCHNSSSLLLFTRYYVLYVHCKNKIAKITNILVSTVARNNGNSNLISRVGCYGYIHVIIIQ